MQNILSTIITILFIYFLVTLTFKLIFVILRYFLSKSLKKRFSGAFSQEKSSRSRDFDSKDIIDAEFKEIKK